MSLLLLFRSTPRAYEDTPSLAVKLRPPSGGRVRDDFTRPDSDSLGPDWSEDESAANFFRIAGNGFELGAGAGSGMARWVGPGASGFGNDQVSKVFFLTSYNPEGGPGVRLSGTRSAANGYALDIFWDGGINFFFMTIYRYDNTNLASSIGTGIATYNRSELVEPTGEFRLEIEGTTLRAYEGETLRLEVIDATHATGDVGFTGAQGSGGGGPHFDWWEGGALSAGLPTNQAAFVNDPNILAKLLVDSPKNLLAALSDGSLIVKIIPTVTDVYEQHAQGAQYTDFPALTFKILITPAPTNLLDAQDQSGLTVRFAPAVGNLLSALDIGALTVRFPTSTDALQNMTEAGALVVTLRPTKQDVMAGVDQPAATLKIVPIEVANILAALSEGALTVRFVPASLATRELADSGDLTVRFVAAGADTMGMVASGDATLRIIPSDANVLTALDSGTLVLRLNVTDLNLLTALASGELLIKIVPAVAGTQGMVEAQSLTFRLVPQVSDRLDVISMGLATVIIRPAVLDALIPGGVQNYLDFPSLTFRIIPNTAETSWGNVESGNAIARLIAAVLDELSTLDSHTFRAFGRTVTKDGMQFTHERDAIEALKRGGIPVIVIAPAARTHKRRRIQ